MQHLLDEFKGLYEGKLRRLQEAEMSGEDTMKVSQDPITTRRLFFGFSSHVCLLC